MTNVRIMTFYDELLLDIAQWIGSQDDEGAKAQAAALSQALSQGERNVPAGGVQAILAAIPAFVAAHPGQRTSALHLRKYLESVLAPAQA